LANPGAEAAVEGLLALKAAPKRQGVSLIVSIFADTVDRYHEVAETIAQVEPAMGEVNISCPNVEAELGAAFATEAPGPAAAPAAARSALACPLSVKLAPSVPNVVRIAEAVVGAGADRLTVSNTMPGMVIGVEARKPVLSKITGGLSGEGLRPVAVR